MLRIRLVGELRVDLDGRALDPIASRRARSLFAWLAYHPGMHPRTRVASVFWPDVLDSSARGSLRTTLTTLRRALGEPAAESVLAERERVGIEDGSQVWIDVREIVRLADEGRAADALALCEGDLLTDLDDDWVLAARQQHRDRVGELLVVLGDAAEADDDMPAAVRFARRRLELDPVSEDAARALMRNLARSGDRAAALAAYDAFRSALRRELGLAPSAATRALVEELREDHGGRAGVDRLPLPGALARGEHAPFVGRREPLAALRAVWRRASAGAAAVAMVVGEAGSGKTRLLTELAGEAHAGGATVLAGRCREDGAAGFAPFTEALRSYAAAYSGALPEWVVRELGRLLPELDPEAGAPAGEPQDARHRLFEAVAAAIGHAARRTPVLLVVEDLHWADPATLQMLEHVVRTVGWAPLLVAGSLRDTSAESAPALHALLGDLRRERDFERVALAGLSGDEVGDLTAAWLGTSDSPAALAADVHRRTGGNPLFVEELVRHLVESGAEQLVEAARTDVPHGVRSVIDRRVAHLPEISAQAVRVAAVAGQDFALADVAAACDAGDEPIAAGLDAAVSAGLVDETQTPGHYRFAHALIREAVLAGLTATRRALLHRRMAEVLEALPDSRRAARAPELARHLLDARPLVDPALAARAALRAAEEATRRLAYEDAAELLERAAAGDLDERDPVRAEVLLALGDARLRSGDAPVADRCFAEAAAIARTLGEHDMVARAALGAAGLTVTVRPERPSVRALLEEAVASLDEASALRPRLLARLAIEVYYVPPATLRERLSEDALAAGRRTGGRSLLEALGARHVALWSPDHTEERLAIADELVATARATGDREAELQGVNWRVPDLFELGELDAVRDGIADHERLAGELRLPSYAWYAPMWRATLALLEGRPEEARRLSDEGDRIGQAAHDDNAELLCEVQRTAINSATGGFTDKDLAIREWHAEHSPAGAAWRTAVVTAAVQRGELDRAQRMVEREVAGLDSVALDANWLYAITGFGILAARLGNVAAAAALYPRLLPYGHRVVTCGRATYCTGSASLSLGLLAATIGDRPAAVAHLEEAVRRNDALGAVGYSAAARHALADLVEDPALRRESETAAAAIGMTLPDGLVRRL